MPLHDPVFSRKSRSSYGAHVLDHLAADGAGFAGGQVTVVTVGQVHANLAGSLHLKLVHRFPSLGNVDLIVALHTVFSPFCFLAVLFRNHSFANIFWSISVNFRKEIQKMTDFIDTPFRFCTDFPARLHSIGICDIVRQNG